MAIRPESDKQIGKGIPGTQDRDLEQYGVWVKAEPQDIQPEPDRDSGGDLGLASSSLPDIGNDIGDESFLSAEEEELLGSIEDIPALGEFSDSSALSSEARALSAEDFSLPDIDDFSADSSADTLDLPDIEVESLSSESLPDSISPDAEIDMDSVVGLDSPAQARASKPEERPPALSGPDFGLPDLVDVSSEFLDLAPAKAGLDELEEIKDVTADFLDEPGEGTSPAAAVEQAEPQFESLDIDLQFDDTIPQSESDSAAHGFEEVSEFDDVLKEEGSRKEEFDDVAALERELSDPTPPSPPAKPAPSAPGAADSSNLATELLLKIATELSSIRSELVSLKSQFAQVQAEALPLPASPSPPQPPVVAEEAEEDQASQKGGPGGFFDEEEDETIALTGDELDNILSSADFTEEIAEEPAPVEPSPESLVLPDDLLLQEGSEETGLIEEEPADSFPALDISEEKPRSFLEPVEPAAVSGLPREEAQAQESLDIEDILPESGDYSLIEEAPIEEIRLENDTETSPREESDDAALAINRLADDGVSPLTEAPEDTSYLEEPLASEEPLDLGEMPFEEAPLVEPSAAELTLDEGASLGTESPHAEVGFPEDLEEIEPLELSDASSAESLPDLELDADIPDFESGISESVLESPQPISEQEDFNLADIDLVDEAKPASDFVPFTEDDLSRALHAEKGLETSAPMDEIQAEETFGEEQNASHPDDISLELDDSFFVAAPSESLEGSAEEERSSAAEQPIQAEASAPQSEPLPAAPLETEAPAPSSNDRLKSDIRAVLSYLDKLLESLPEEKIEEFAHSEHFDTYKKLFEELGLV